MEAFSCSIPLSGIKLNNHKINYFDFISSLQNEDCNQALKRILPKIDMQKINAVVDNTPFISDIQKQFYKTMVLQRKERILDFSYQLLRQQEAIATPTSKIRAAAEAMLKNHQPEPEGEPEP